jgi:hypothetical protein
MNRSMKWVLAVALLGAGIAVSSEPLFARGAAANIMNSPGYQRRLQESRQQLPQPGVQTSTHRRKVRHRR